MTQSEYESVEYRRNHSSAEWKECWEERFLYFFRNVDFKWFTVWRQTAEVRDLSDEKSVCPNQFLQNVYFNQTISFF